MVGLFGLVWLLCVLISTVISVLILRKLRPRFRFVSGRIVRVVLLVSVTCGLI